MQNKTFAKNVLEPMTSRDYAVGIKCFILHVTTSYVQHVFNMLKHLQNICKNVLVFYFTCIPTSKTFLQMFCKRLFYM